MSLVGTRPPTVDEWEQYEPHHRARMAFRPGLTGLWQVSGRSNITDFEEVVKLDTKYIDEWSLGVDLKILVETVTQMALDKLDYENETIDIAGFNHEIKKAKILYFAKASLTSDILISKLGMRDMRTRHHITLIRQIFLI